MIAFVGGEWVALVVEMTATALAEVTAAAVGIATAPTTSWRINMLKLAVVAVLAAPFLIKPANDHDELCASGLSATGLRICEDWGRRKCAVERVVARGQVSGATG